MAKRMRLRNCSKLSANRNRSSGEGSWTGWGLLMDMGARPLAPTMGCPQPTPSWLLAGITCLTSGSRSSRRTTWPRCWTRSIRKPWGYVRHGATSIPGKNKNGRHLSVCNLISVFSAVGIPILILPIPVGTHSSLMSGLAPREGAGEETEDTASSLPASWALVT